MVSKAMTEAMGSPGLGDTGSCFKFVQESPLCRLRERFPVSKENLGTSSRAAQIG